VQNKLSPDDIIHFLSLPSTPVSQVEDMIAAALHVLETNGNGLNDVWADEIVRLAVDVFRSKSVLSKSEAEKDDFLARSLVGHEICSVVACRKAWEECSEGDGFDLNAAWHLVGLTGWIIEFFERLMKDCVLFSSDSRFDEVAKSLLEGLPQRPQSPVKSTNLDDDPFGQPDANDASPGEGNSGLLHLVHPFAVDNLLAILQSVKRFRGYLGSLTAKGEHAVIAKQVLVDIVDMCGVNFDILETILSGLKPEAKAAADRNPDGARRSLASLKPISDFKGLQYKAVSQIVKAEVIDKPRLFIKPDELVDGILGLSLNAQSKKHERDVITKSFLPGRRNPLVCLRCRGKSEIGGFTPMPGSMSFHWLTWERSWMYNCICGGLWSNSI